MNKIDLKELKPYQIELVNRAIDIREKAYSPYSKFKVGAALMDADGNVHTGCNIESVDFTLTSHAEMVAVDSMVKSGARSIKEIAIVAQAEKIISPCGLCRQKMYEFSDKGQVLIICVNIDGDGLITDVYTATLSDILPCAFDAF